MASVFKNDPILYLFYLGISALNIAITYLTIKASDQLGLLTTGISVSGLSSCGQYIIRAGIFFLLQIVCQEYIFKEICSSLQQYVYKSIQARTLEQIISLPLDNERILESDNVINLAQNDCETVVVFMSETMVKILSQGIILSGISFFIYMQNRLIFILYLAASIIAIALQAVLSKVVTSASRNIKSREIAMNKAVRNTIDNRLVLKKEQKQEFARSLFYPYEEAYAKANIMFSCVSAPMHVCGVFLGMLPILTVSLGGLYMIPRKEIEISTFMTIFYLCQSIIPYQLHYADLISAAAKERISLLRISDFWKVRDNYDPPASDGISLQHVSFKYPGSAENTLQDICLEILPGEKVAFIGDSGSGKTTALKIIGRIIRPDEGEVRLCPVVFTQQFPFLFTDTIKNNIQCAGKDESRYHLSLHDAVLLSFLEKQESRDQTLLMNNAANVSGGQKQRIALARALNTETNAYVFDEVLSALDNTTASKIMHNLVRRKETIVISLHQMEYLPLMDRIVLFDHGKATFQGSYEEYCRYIEEKAGQQNELQQ